jgi:hypothetical protein
MATVPDVRPRKTFSGGRGGIVPKKREPNGREQRSRPEERDDAQSVVIEYRQRHFDAKEVGYINDRGDKKVIKLNDPLWGYALGRLRVSGMGHLGDGINQDQFEAGEWYGKRKIAWYHVKGYTIPNLPSPSMQMVAKGLPCTPELDPDYVTRTLRQYGDARSAVIHYVGPRGAELLDRVVIQGYDPQTDSEKGTLRMALNALARLRRIEERG